MTGYKPRGHTDDQAPRLRRHCLWRYLSDLLWIVAGIIALIVLVGIVSGRDILPARAGFMLAFASLYGGSMVYKFQTDRRIASLKAQLAEARKAPSDASPAQ